MEPRRNLAYHHGKESHLDSAGNLHLLLQPVQRNSALIVAATRAGKVLAWLPIPLFLVALAVFSIRATDTAYGTPFLLITLNLVFGAFTSFIVFTLVSRSFLLRGTPDLLLIGCGALVWGCTALISTSANIQDVNVTVTIYNLGTILSAFCHALGSLLTGRAKPAFRSSGLILTAACVIVLALLFLAALGTLEQWTPVFFIQGTGGTPIRQTIVALSAACFLFAGVVIRPRQGQRVSPFAWWYSISTMLIAVGLAGLLLQYSFGTPVNWVARAAQYLGCTYMLAAAVLSAKDARDWEVPSPTSCRRPNTGMRTSSTSLPTASPSTNSATPAGSAASSRPTPPSAKCSATPRASCSPSTPRSWTPPPLPVSP